MLLRKHPKRFLLFFIWINFSLLAPGSLVQGGEGDKIPFSFAPSGAVQGQVSSKTLWQRVETKHAIIQYETLKDLKKFDRKIDYSPGEWGFKKLFSASGSKDSIASINKKVEALYERVQEILDMRGRIKKVIINIYPNKKRLHEAYYTITGRDCRIRAWYIYESNTIYINADDVHEGILAHEMAHSIIDHYFSVRPPRATAEILARYVDKHLHF